MTAAICQSKTIIDFDNDPFYTTEREIILKDNTAVYIPSKTYRAGELTEKYVPKINKNIVIKGGQAELVKCTFQRRLKTSKPTVFYILTAVCQVHLGTCDCSIKTMLLLHKAHGKPKAATFPRKKLLPCEKRSREIAEAGKLIKTERMVTREVWKVQHPEVQRIEVYGYVNEENEKVLREKHLEILKLESVGTERNTKVIKKLKAEYQKFLRTVEGTINIDPRNFPDNRTLLYTGDKHRFYKARERNKNSVFYPGHGHA